MGSLFRPCRWSLYRQISYERVTSIPTPQFNKALLLIRKDTQRWKKTYEYDNFDAWIDYGEEHYKSVSHNEYSFVEKMKYGRDTAAGNDDTLIFYWTNWFEGEIKGPKEVVKQLLNDTYAISEVTSKPSYTTPSQQT